MVLLAAALLAAGCERKSRLSVNDMARRWYIVDYPFYQSCDRGSYVQLNADGTCKAELLCSDADGARYQSGTWSLNDDDIVIDCAVLSGLSLARNEGKVTRLTDTEMDLTLRVYGIAVEVNLSTRNPSEEE